MKTLKFMLAAATAIGLASAYADPESGASTTFESLPMGTPVVTGLNDEGGSTGLSYFYYTGENLEDNESVITNGTPDIEFDRPKGATGVSSKILQVSTGTDPLLRAFTSFTQGSSPVASTFTSDVYVDTLVQFTVTPYTDPVNPGDEDKLMIYLKEYTNEVGVVEGTNLVVIGGFCVTDGQFEPKEYTIPGLEIEPNTWHRLTVKAIANYGALDGYKHPAFQVFFDGDENPCVFDSFAAAENPSAGEEETGFVAPFNAGSFAELGAGTVVFSLKCTGDDVATLKAVGFAGEGKVDDLMITTLDPFFTAVDFTFAGVSGVTAEQTPGTDTWTFSAPAGSVITSFLVNGNPVAAAVGATSYEWTATSAEEAGTVIVAAGKQLTAAANPWYDSPKGFVLAENLPHQGDSDGKYVAAFHGQGQDEYLGLTYSTNPLQFDLYNVDGTNAPTSVYNVPAANVTTPGFRGVAISKALGIAMTMAYATTTTMYAYPLAGGAPAAVSKPSTHAFDAAAFSPDGKYLFSNAIEGEGSKSPAVVKWSVSANNVTNVALTKVGAINASGRHRNLAYARINNRDLVFAMADDCKVDVLDMTGDDSTAWTMNTLISNLPAHSYGSLCVSGVNATGATPKLTVATSTNNGVTKADVLNVYTLTVPASGAVTATLLKSFDEDALTAAFFGNISDANRYGNTVYVTDDDATIYFGRPDNKLYAGIYVPKYDITFISGEGSTTNELSVYEGDAVVAPAAAEVAGKTFNAWSPAVAAATADATYTATYNWISYTITYKNADDSAFTDWASEYTAPTSFTAETPVALPAAANVDVSGTFNSWTNESGTVVSSTSGLYADLVVFANISAPSGEDIKPGEESQTTYDTAQDATNALANVTITAPEAVTNALAPAAQAEYLGKFEAKVVPAGKGQYKIEIDLTAKAKADLQTEVDNAAAEVVADLDEEQVTLTTTPGFYYSFEYGTTLEGMTEVGTRTLATSTSLELDRPTTENATSGFYKVLVNVAPAAVTP